MINRLIEFSARQRGTVIGLVLALAIWGWWSIGQIPLDALPDLSDTQVILYSRWDRSPDLIEDQVTYPIVTAMLGAPKVKAVRGISDFGFDPARLMIVKVPTAAAALRAGAQALTCTGIGAVIIEPWGAAKIFDLVASRKLTLAAAKHGVSVFALRHAAQPSPSTAETRWCIRACPQEVGDWEMSRFDAELLRNRHGPLGRWIMEWDCNGNFHAIGAAHSRVLPPPAFHRPPAAETEGLRRAG